MINSVLKMSRFFQLQGLMEIIHRAAIRKRRESIFYITKVFSPSDLLKLTLSDTDRCLVLAPHADDESIALGGLLIQQPEVFDILCLTDCSTGNPEKPREEVVKERRGEFEQAMASIGVNSYRFNLEIPSDDLLNHYQEFERILLQADLGRYSHVFLPHPFDQHPDHIAAAEHFHLFIRRQMVPIRFKIALFEVWTPMAMPNYFADISAVMNKKKELIGRYISQVNRIDYAGRISGLNNYRGMIPHVKYAECFQLMTAREYTRLPINSIRC